MISEVVFHIGDPHAGAEIRAALTQAARSSDRLAGGPFVAFVSREGNHGLSGALRRKGGARVAQPRFERLAARIDRAAADGADMAVVCDDGFAMVAPERLAAAIGEYMPHYRDAVRVIAYVRPHADRLWGDYARAAAVGSETEPGAFVKAAIAAEAHTYAPRFNAWRAVFGSRFILRPLIGTALSGGNVAGDFLHVLSGETDFDCRATCAGADGLTRGDLAMLRAFRRKGGKPGHRDLKETRAIAARHLCGVLETMAAPGGGGVRFSRAVSERIQAHYAADARALDQAFFDRPLMQTALADAVQGSPADSGSGPLADHCDAQGQRLATLWAHLADDFLARDPADWVAHFQPRQGGRAKTRGGR